MGRKTKGTRFETNTTIAGLLILSVTELDHRIGNTKYLVRSPVCNHEQTIRHSNLAQRIKRGTPNLCAKCIRANNARENFHRNPNQPYTLTLATDYQITWAHSLMPANRTKPTRIL